MKQLLKMKPFFLTIIQFLIISQLLGQSFFEVDSVQIKTKTISRIYNFSYAFKDSLSLLLTDSVLQYSSDKKTIVKTISYSVYDKKSEPAIQIKYLDIIGRDSISKHFYEGKLSMTYQQKYDTVGRIIYYGMKDHVADSTYDRGFEWLYEYRDSIIVTGKIEIQTIFVVDTNGDKRFHFRVFNIYDNKNRKIKEIRASEPNDPTAQITIYTYNDQDSLIFVNYWGDETFSEKEKHINTKCDIENEYSFVDTNYDSVKQLIQQLLWENKNLLTKAKCENYFLTLVSFDKQTRLKIIKQQPYHCGGRKVIFRTTTQL